MEQLPKIAITTESEKVLDDMYTRVNKGFSSGRVTKTQLASWILSYFHADAFAKQLDKIRADYFDEIAHLEAVVKQMKQAKKNAESVELDKLLSPLRGPRKLKPVAQDVPKGAPQK